MKWDIDTDWIEGTGYRTKKNFLRVEESEAKYLVFLLPILKRKLIRMEKKYDHYNGIHEIGEATPKQQTKMIELENEVSNLFGFIRDIELQIKN